MKFHHWKNRTALVTGASSGLGADFARHLAAAGVNLVLVARRAESLDALGAELRKQQGVQVTVLPMDLGLPGAPERLHAETLRLGLTVDILINNAGFGLFGEFLDIPAERERAMVELDVLVPLALSRLYGQEMVARRQGWILQIASIGGYQPNPLYAAYGAAKAFILNWGEAVNFEWRKAGVTMSVLSPGITATEFLKVSGQRATLYQRLVMMDSPTVTRIGLEALAKGKASVVPGLVNKLTLLSNRLLPRPCIPPMVHRLMQNH
jgi:hypothetical protein